jgi:hypothetical protein
MAWLSRRPGRFDWWTAGDGILVGPLSTMYEATPFQEAEYAEVIQKYDECLVDCTRYMQATCFSSGIDRLAVKSNRS